MEMKEIVGKASVIVGGVITTVVGTAGMALAEGEASGIVPSTFKIDLTDWKVVMGALITAGSAFLIGRKVLSFLR